jgi:nucleotide-binding universal stress UspA family protein
MYRHILVPLDGSHLAEQVLPHVKALASDQGVTRITLLISVPPQNTPGSERPETVTHIEATPHDREAARRYLKPIASDLQLDGCAVKMEICNQPAAEAIIDYATHHDVDVIVIATHGRSGLSRWIFGSVTQKVIQAASIPVLVVRPTAAAA